MLIKPKLKAAAVPVVLNVVLVNNPRSNNLSHFCKKTGYLSNTTMDQRCMLQITVCSIPMTTKVTTLIICNGIVGIRHVTLIHKNEHFTVNTMNSANFGRSWNA